MRCVYSMRRAAACAAVLTLASSVTGRALAAPPMPSVTLSNGVVVPAVALGVGYHHLIKDPNTRAHNSTAEWLAAGGRHVDTAHWYNDEGGVGDAIAASSVARDDVFITTKLPGANTSAGMEAYLNESLSLLRTGYVDLYLIHVPSSEDGSAPPAGCGTDGTWASCRRAAWATMEGFYASGRARAIGVSNWAVKHLQDILPTAKVKPHVNQVELHPYLPTTAGKGLIPFCASQGITVMAYAAIGGGAGPGRDPQSNVGPILAASAAATGPAKRLGVTPAAVSVRWSVQQGWIADVRSSTPAHMTQNLAVGTFELEEAEVAALAALPVQKAVWFPDLDALN